LRSHDASIQSHKLAQGPRGIPEYVVTHFTWYRFAAIQIWIFVLFLIYTSVAELNARLGKGELGEDLSRVTHSNADAASSGSPPDLADQTPRLMTAEKDVG
jgi:hypothetical protein